MSCPLMLLPWFNVDFCEYLLYTDDNASGFLSILQNYTPAKLPGSDTDQFDG